MAHQVVKPEGVWCYRCKTCSEVFTSSQGLAGHQGKHKSEGTWRKGVAHEKFFVPSADLPIVYRQMGNRKTTPTVLRGQGRFHRLHPRNQAVQEPRGLLDRPWSNFDPLQQAVMPQVPPPLQTHGEIVHVPHVVAPASVNPLHVDDRKVKEEVEQLDLELRL